LCVCVSFSLSVSLSLSLLSQFQKNLSFLQLPSSDWHHLFCARVEESSGRSSRQPLQRQLRFEQVNNFERGSISGKRQYFYTKGPAFQEKTLATYLRELFQRSIGSFSKKTFEKSL
jgi:hypothetical protein